MKMICENAGECNVVNCNHKKPHDESFFCKRPCRVLETAGSICIPYVEQSFSSAPDALASEQERKASHVEAIVGTKEEPKLLTDHAKYCRLSKQAGGLCGLSIKQYSCACLDSKTLDMGQATGTWEICAVPSKQQPVELPKDPLEELIQLTSNSLADLIFVNKSEEQVLREFAEKVRDL